MTAATENVSSRTMCSPTPRRLQQHNGHSSHWQPRDLNGFRNFVTLTFDLWLFDLWVNACQATAIEYICNKFGANGSSRFFQSADIGLNSHAQTHKRRHPQHSHRFHCSPYHESATTRYRCKMLKN